MDKRSRRAVARHIDGPGPFVGAHALASNVDRDLGRVEESEHEHPRLVLVHRCCGVERSVEHHQHARCAIGVRPDGRLAFGSVVRARQRPR